MISEVCNEDGSMSRTPQLIRFCEQHRARSARAPSSPLPCPPPVTGAAIPDADPSRTVGLVLTSIADLIEYLNEEAEASS